MLRLLRARHDGRSGLLEGLGTDDDKLERPEVYRTQRYFGVVERVHTESWARPVHYLVFVRSRLGRVHRGQLEAAGVVVDRLGGHDCVINGLDEVVMIGSQSIPAVVPTSS